MSRPGAGGGACLLVRHPEPRGAAGLCYGRLDLALARESDLDAIARRHRGFRPTAVWSSPAGRCRRLAERLCAPHRLRPRLDARLRELDFGGWEGRRWDEVPRARLDHWARAPLSRGPVDGESAAGLIRRVRSIARAIRARPGRHLVVSHAGTLSVLARVLAGRRVDLAAARLPFGGAARV